MTVANDPVFPTTADSAGDGLTKRELFAALCMASTLSRNPLQELRAAADDAVLAADALMSRLNRIRSVSEAKGGA